MRDMRVLGSTLGSTPGAGHIVYDNACNLNVLINSDSNGFVAQAMMPMLRQEGMSQVSRRLEVG
jgi:hypothetical protein